MKRKSVIILLFSLIVLLLLFLLILFACRHKEPLPAPDEEAASTAESSVDTTEHETNEESVSLPSASSTPEEEPPKAEESEILTDESIPTETSPISDPHLTYTVFLFDHHEEAITETLTVRLTHHGQTVASAKAENGAAVFYLPPDIYTIEVDCPESSPYVYPSDGQNSFAESITSVSIILHSRPLPSRQHISAYSLKQKDFCEFEAEEIGEGLCYPEAAPKERTYFLFTPTEEGVYEISLDSAYAHLVGYFGTPSFARENSIAENTEDNLFVLNVKPSNIGATYLLGVTSYEKTALPCTLSILRVGSAILDIADLPTEHFSAQNLPDTSFHALLESTASIIDLDIEDPELSVFLNETDGFYHIGHADGPTVYMRLSTPSAYLDSLETVATKTGLTRYVCDESGNCTHKEQYNTLFLDYAAIADPTFGLVPLTKELADAIKNVGEGMEWWKIGSQNYLFGITAISPRTAFLFACCTVE